MLILRKRIIRQILCLLQKQKDSYRNKQKNFCSGSIEWKYYQSKINALNDFEIIIKSNFKI